MYCYTWEFVFQSIPIHPNPTVLSICLIFYPPNLRLVDSRFVIANTSFVSDMCDQLFQTRQFFRFAWFFIPQTCDWWIPDSLLLTFHSYLTNVAEFLQTRYFKRILYHPILQFDDSGQLLLTISWYRPWDWYVSGMLSLTPHAFPNPRWKFCSQYVLLHPGVWFSTDD